MTGGNAGKHIKSPDLFGWKLDTGNEFYFLCLVITILATLIILNLLHSPTGRAFVAIRDSEISAQSMGIQLSHYKTLSFAISAAFDASAFLAALQDVGGAKNAEYSLNGINYGNRHDLYSGISETCDFIEAHDW